MALEDQAPGSTAGVDDRDTSGLSDQAPGEVGFGGFEGGGGGVDQAPGGFEDIDRAETELTDIAPGENLTDAQLRDFSEFTQQSTGFIANIQEILGLGPDVTGAVKRGAEISDPASFSAGAKTGGAFELAQAVSSAAGLPAAVGVGIVDRVVSAISNPAFSVGRQSVQNRLSAAAGPAGTIAGIVGQSANLAQAVELGLRLGGAAVAAGETGLFGTGAGGPARTVQSESEFTPSDVRPTREIAVSEQRGAFVTTATEAVQRSVSPALPEDDRFSRSDLRIRSA